MKQICTCGHPIDNHLEQVAGKPIAGECNNCDCVEYEQKKLGVEDDSKAIAKE